MHKQKCAFVAIAALAASACFAGKSDGTVSQLAQRASDGLTYVVITGTHTDGPVCATHPYWIIADENSGAGKKQFAMLMLAKANGTRVSISGSNTCSRWGDGEDIDTVTLLD